MAGEGGTGTAVAGTAAGGTEEEAGGAAAESGETPLRAGGETETETGEEQGERVVAVNAKPHGTISSSNFTHFEDQSS